MNRRHALPLLAAGFGLLALAATILPFAPQGPTLAEQGYGARFGALRPAALAALVLSVLAALACWWRPHRATALLLLALALGSATGAATLMVAPGIFDTTPARFALLPS